MFRKNVDAQFCLLKNEKYYLISKRTGNFVALFVKLMCVNHIYKYFMIMQ